MADDILDIIEIGLSVRFGDASNADLPDSVVISEYIEEFRKSYGGARYYVKRGYRKHSPEIKRKIKREYNGKNGAELRKRLGISRTVFYECLKKSG